MKAVVSWAVRNSPAMNTLMLAVVVAGAACMFQLRRERFPESQPETIQISVSYPGASPEETEHSICLRIEEAIRSVSGIKKITAIAQEGSGSVSAELETHFVDPHYVLNEVRSAIEQISTFPENAEKPQVRLNVRFRNVISLALVAPPENIPEGDEKRSIREREPATLQLRYVYEQLREELLLLPAVSHVNSWQRKPYQIDVEISESTLRQFGLTHADVTDAIRKANIEVPAGELRTDQTEYLLRITDRNLTGSGIASIPVVHRPDGVVLTVGDLGTVHDGLIDLDMFALVNGRPAMVHEVVRTPSQDMFEIYEQVKTLADQKQLPDGYELMIWNDYSRQARERLQLLTDNALFGLVLVFVILALFLHGRLAFWVAAGIPVALFGTCGIMLLCGATLNLYSMFAFVMALGIVVDDAIVVSENVFRHRQMGKSALQAAIDGTSEVATSVICSVLTTVIAFLPLVWVSGELGKRIAVIPLAVVSMLLISLVEGLLILPCHLSHLPEPRDTWLSRLPKLTERGLNRIIDRIYMPALRWCLARPAIAISSSVAVVCLTVGLYHGGFTRFVLEKKLDYAFVYTTVEYPKGTPPHVIDKATRSLEASINRVDAGTGPNGEKLFWLVYRAVGFSKELQTHRGEIAVEFDPELAFRPEFLGSQQVISKWRDEAEEFPDALRVMFWGINSGKGGRPIEVSLLASDVDQLETIATAVKEQLATYAGVHDIIDSRGPGKWELQLKLKPDAQAIGVRLDEIAKTVRAAYYGDEAMRLQRGQHEVRLVVRYPPDERHGLATLDEIRVRLPDGREVPLPELVDVTVQRGYSQILRIDQQRAVTIQADVNEDEANSRDIVTDLRENFLPDLLSSNPGVITRWEGQQKETRESVGSLFIGFAIAIFGMFGLLTLEFRSYVQPLLILAVIPFGFTGAIWAHCLFGEPITLFSLFGMVTLSGILANDSIVLIDFINRRREEGATVYEAIIESGRSRFRPVVLTSVTTVAALLPLLFERNTQAQNLIPMALSVAGGLSLATVWVLLFVPLLYRLTCRDDGHATDGTVVV
ncbi:MAG: efflux RND transporter permease subunit [Planctomycetota bacterium]|nr:efflux RND transporter permease subunit [Planctomycetota bacterium]MDA1249980.1 efflux RND transporter permease subunit [Planctomycetota bacterium]